MRIRDWSSKKMGIVWLVGSAAECLLLLAAVWIGRANRSEMPSAMEQLWAREDSVSRGYLPPPPPSTAAARTRADRLLRDSLGLELVRRGDTIVGIVPMSARGDSTVKAAGDAVSGMISALRVGLPLVLLVLTATFLPIPIVLIGISIIWWRGRSEPNRVPGTA